MKRTGRKNRAIGILLTMAMIFVLTWTTAPAYAQNKVVVIPLTETVQLPYTGPPAPVPKTGQTTCWDVAGNVIDCSGTGQDGDLKEGVTWPDPRFTDNGDGTVTDHLTGLVWLKDGNCTKFFAEDTVGQNSRPWDQAIEAANKLSSTPDGLYCGLKDGSADGDWRLPNRKELDSLIDLGQFNPALPPDCPLRASTVASYYWSATTSAYYPNYAWHVSFPLGYDNSYGKSSYLRVRAVRGGQ